MKIQSWDEHFIRSIFISAALALALIGCGGGGGGGTGTTSYTVGGTVSGLAGSVVLRENISGNNLTVTTNGTYTFTVQVASGSAYYITVLTQPAGQTCTISGGTGIISGNVNNVAVACTDNPHMVSGSVTGLPVSGSVELQNNGGDNLIITTDGSFTFTTPVANGSTYKVTVLSTVGGTCSVSSGAGTVSGSDVSATVVCSVNAYTVGGTVSGLNGSAVLQLNDGGDLSVTNGSFTFTATPVADLSPYYVTLLSLQFPNQTCTITDGSGIIASANVTNVAVGCVKNTTPRFAYVANSSADTVSAYTIDANSGVLTGVGAVATGTNPYSVTVDPYGKFAYVANNGSNDVSAYTVTSTGALTPIKCSGTCSGINFPAGSFPGSVSVDPTSKFAYVANQGDGINPGTVSAYTITGTGALTPIICNGTCNGINFPAGIGAYSVTVDPSGQFVYVANFTSNSVPGSISAYTIDPGTGTAGALTQILCGGGPGCNGNNFLAGTGPGSVSVDPTGKFAYVANYYSEDVSAYSIDTDPNSITFGALTPIICSGSCSATIPANFAAGTGPGSVTVDPLGKFVYVANWTSGDVSAYSIDGAGALTPIPCSGTTCSTVIPANFAAGTGPFSITVDPSGKFVYVANDQSNDVSAYTIDGAGALAPIPCSGATCSAMIPANFAAGTNPFSITTTIH